MQLNKPTCFLLFVCTLIISVNAGLYAQISDISFKHISYKEGLSQSPIFSMAQDKTGFIWLGTSDGLLRYDGYEFKSFQHDDSDENSISTNRIQSIFQDSGGTLWIGTANGGLNEFDRGAERFFHIKDRPNGTSKDYISSLLEDRRGDIWVATLSGLRIVNRKSRRLEHVKELSSRTDIINGKTRFLCSDLNKTIWLSLDSGLARIDDMSRKAIALPEVLKKNRALMKARILVIRSDNKGNLWFGTEKTGVFKYDSKRNICIHYSHSSIDKNTLISNGIKDILINNDQAVWIATREGLSILDADSTFNNYQHDRTDASSLSYNLLWCFLKDQAGNVWISTFAGGIDIYYEGNSNFNNIGEFVAPGKLGLNNPVVTSIVEEPTGGVWVGTNGGGLNYLNQQTGEARYYPVRDVVRNRGNNIVRSLENGNGKNLWVGTFDGLYEFNKEQKTFNQIRLANQKDNRIISLLSDPEGIWAASVTGGLHFIGKDGSLELFRFSEKNDNSISSNNITVLLRDLTNNNILVGTEEGFNCFDIRKRIFTRHLEGKTRNSLSNNSILSIFQDSRRRIWVGTEGGLNYFDSQNKKFYLLDLNEGSSNEIVLAIVEDNAGDLWVNTNKGISRITIRKFSLPFNRENFRIINYTSTSGLASSHFLGTAIKTKNGKLLFGGMSGITSFFPDRIFKNKFVPNIVLTGFLIDNKPVNFKEESSPLKQSITETKEVTLTHDQNYISFKYAALNFINPENNQYAYKLEGISGHQDWSYVGNQRVATFTNLEAGKYVFIVKASNNDGVWNNDGARVMITVLPPIWKTWWAYLIYIVIIGYISFTVFIFLRNRAALKRNLYLEHMQNERQQELYQMKLNFFTNISHELRTPLTLILGPLERLFLEGKTESQHKHLGIIKKNADRLMKLITELLDFRKAEEGHMKIQCSCHDLVPFCRNVFDSFQEMALERNITYSFISKRGSTMIYFDKDQLETVIINLLSNAFKFTKPHGEINFIISDESDDNKWVEIHITDNGKVIPPEIHEKIFEGFFQADDGVRQNTGSGIGLALSKKITELHKGAISVSSGTENHPLTTFTISLRKGKEHLGDTEIVSDHISLPKIPETFSGTQDSVIYPDEEQPVYEKKYTLLIAEDNEEVRALIAGYFENQYYIIEFENGLNAWDFMKDEIPDLIISDIMMPGMDGLELCKSVKSNESTSHIPFILLTAKASIVHQLDGLSTGANAYISKPFSLQILALNVKNLLASQEAMRQKFGQRLLLEPQIIDKESPEHKFISKLMAIIDSKMGDPDFSVDDLVNEMGMSRTVLYKKVQMLTNFSIADLVKSMRLKKAALLFEQGNLSVADIAYEVGFNDRKYFSKEFKKVYNLSPTDYIKKIKPAK